MDYRDIIEIKECETIEETNKYLDTEEWVLLKIHYELRLCFQKIVTENYERVQPFHKISRAYIIGRMKE